MKNSEAVDTERLQSDITSRIRGFATIIGIGNIMRADDGCGPKLIAALKTRNLKAHLFDCGTVPENYIFPILSTSCDTVIIVDAADFSMAPGNIKVFGVDEVSRAGFSTHNPSLRLFADLLTTGKDTLHIFVVSIQAKTIAFGEPLSKEVLSGIDRLADIFTKALA